MTKNSKSEKILERAAYLRNVQGKPRVAAEILRKYLLKLPAKMRSGNHYLLLANFYLDIGETKKAIANFKKSAKIAGKESDRVLLADILRKWGYLFLHTKRNLKTAGKKIAESVRIINSIRRRHQNREILKVGANCYASLGNYYQFASNLTKAKKSYLKALGLAKRAGFRERIVTVLGDLGNLAIQERNWKQAEKLLQEAAAGAERYYKHALPSSLLRLGRLFNRRENPRSNTPKALAYFKKSLRTARRGGWRREQADALLELKKLKAAKNIYKQIGYKKHL